MADLLGTGPNADWLRDITSRMNASIAPKTDPPPQPHDLREPISSPQGSRNLGRVMVDEGGKVTSYPPDPYAEVRMSKDPSFLDRAPDVGLAMLGRGGDLTGTVNPSMFAATVINPQNAQRAGSVLSRMLPFLKRTAPPPGAQPLAQELEAKWLDELAPIRHLEQLGEVAPKDSPYQAARMYAGHYGKIVEKERELRRILQPVAKDNLIPDLDRFLEMERHKELFARPDIGAMYQTPGNLTPTDVDNVLSSMRQRLGPDRMGQIDRAAQQTRMWSDNILREYHDAGMIGDEAYQAIQDANHHYAPLQRTAYLADEADKMPAGGRTFNVREQPVVKGIKGSTQEVLPATEAFLRNAYKMTTLAERNKVNSRIAALADVPEFSGVIRQLHGDMAPGAGEGAISTFVDGQKRSYAVPAPVAQAVTGMGVRDVNMLEKAVGATKRAMIEGSTSMYLPFIAKNVWRDWQTATLRGAELGGAGFTPIDWVKGLTSAIGRDAHFDDYLRSGAAFSGFFDRQQNVQQSLASVVEPQWKKVGRNLLPWKALQTAAQTSELAPRIGYYRKAIERGFDPETAGMMARNATVDFAKSGSAMKAFNLFVPFVNARTQGAMNVGSSLVDHPIRSAMALGAMVGIPGYKAYMHNVTQYPQVWDDIRDSVKQKNFLVIYGDRKDAEGNYLDVAKIPKGDVGQWFGNPMESFLEWHRGADTKGFANLATQEASDISPIDFAREGQFSWPTLASSVLPPVMKAAVVEPAANQNLYTGRKIETDEMQKADPQNRYTINTPPWLVKAGGATKYLGISPVMLQNMITTQFGGVGRMVAGDVRPERDLLAERTGLGPAARAFTGATGGGVDERRQVRREVINREGAGEWLDRDREAQRLWVKMHAAPANARLGVLQDSLRSGKMDLPTFTRFMSVMEEGIKGMTPYERGLSADPVEQRAKTIVGELERMPAQERLGFFKRLAEVGVANDAVADKMAEVYAKRGATPAPAGQARELSPMEKAFGVAPAAPKPQRELSDMEKAFGVR